MTRVLYQPKGRAAEYAVWAVNLYRGCPHGCAYCYAPATVHMSRADFGNVRPRDNVLTKLRLDLEDTWADKEEVLLCFTCDPYPGIEQEQRITRRAISLLHDYGRRVRILTKAGPLAQRDFDLLGPQDAFGVTLTLVSHVESRRWEPGAAMPVERIDNLRVAHEHGIPTWVSLEPVIDPNESLALILATYDYVDEYRLGTLNYHPHTRTIDWADYGKQAVALLGKLGKRYVLKKDLAEKMQ